MSDRKALMEKYGRLNARFDARFAYMMALRDVVFDQDTGMFRRRQTKKPLCHRSFLMHADDDIFAEEIANERAELK